jgi:hypothetical protein
MEWPASSYWPRFSAALILGGTSAGVAFGTRPADGEMMHSTIWWFPILVAVIGGVVVSLPARVGWSRQLTAIFGIALALGGPFVVIQVAQVLNSHDDSGLGVVGVVFSLIAIVAGFFGQVVVPARPARPESGGGVPS